MSWLTVCWISKNQSLILSLSSPLPPSPHTYLSIKVNSFLTFWEITFAFQPYPYLSVSQRHSLLYSSEVYFENLTHIRITSLPLFPAPSNQRIMPCTWWRSCVFWGISPLSYTRSLCHSPCHHCAFDKRPTIKRLVYKSTLVLLLEIPGILNHYDSHSFITSNFKKGTLII